MPEAPGLPLRRPATLALAVVLPVVTLLFRMTLPASLSERPLFALFMPGIAVVALLGGPVSGLLATAVSLVFSALFLAPPVGRFAIASGLDLFQWTVLGVSGIVASLLSGALHASRARAAERLREARAVGERLRESEERFSRAFHDNPAGLVVTRLSDGEVLEVNAAFCRLLGYERGELIGRTTTDLGLWANPADRDGLRRILGSGGAARDSDFAVRTRSGATRTLHGSVGPVEMGGAACLLSTLEDVTERRTSERLAEVQHRLALARLEAEEALRESEERFRVLVDGAPDAIFVQAGGRFLYVNPSLVRLLGVPGPEALLGQEFLGRVAPDFHEAVRARIDEQRASGRPSPPMEQVYLRADGSRVPVETSAVPLRFGGEDAHAVFVRDLSERKAAETGLQRARDTYASLYRNLLNSVVHARVCFAGETPVDLELLSTNPAFAAVTGITAPVEGRRISEVLPGSDLTNREALLTFGRVAVTGEPIRWEHQVPELDRWFSVMVYSPARGEVVIVGENITERKRAEEEIRRLAADLERRVLERTAELTAANRELDSFSYAVSHDLRAPLRATSGFAQALLEDCGETLCAEGRRHVERIVTATRRMNDLIEGLLVLSRSGRAELLRADVDASAVAERLLRELEQGDGARRVGWEVEPGLRVAGDPRMIEAALANLLGNAWKYTGDTAAPRIRVHAEERGDGRWICVSDNGAGFEADLAGRLFQPFQRLHEPERFPGLGIGLATVRRIVERHGGRVEARGEPGRGATFSFLLPC